VVKKLTWETEAFIYLENRNDMRITFNNEREVQFSCIAELMAFINDNLAETTFAIDSYSLRNIICIVTSELVEFYGEEHEKETS
jgi:hypothetical protein